MNIIAGMALASTLLLASVPAVAQSSSANGTQTAVPGVGPGGAGTTSNTGNGMSSGSAMSGKTIGQGTATSDDKKLKQQGISAGNKPAE